MKRQLTISVFVAMMTLIAVCFAQIASADERGIMQGKGGMKKEGKMQEMMLDNEHPIWKHLMSLGLDEKQKEAMKEIKSRVIKEMIKKRADARVAGIEMKELIEKDPVEMKAVEAKLKKIEALKTEMHLSLIKAVEEAKSKLMPEQRKKFKRMREISLDMRPPMMGGMMHDDMRMPPPYDIQNEMHSEMEHMPGPPPHEIPMQRESEQ